MSNYNFNKSKNPTVSSKLYYLKIGLIFFCAIWWGSITYMHVVLPSKIFSETHQSIQNPSKTSVAVSEENPVNALSNYDGSLNSSGEISSSSWKRLGRVYIVNLPYRTEKWNTALNAITKSIIFQHHQIQRSIAIYGKGVDLIDLHQRYEIGEVAYRSLISPRKIGGFYMTPGGLGCFLSHIQVWKKCVELNQSVIVFEDDISLVSNFDRLFSRVLQDLPSDFGLFYFADMVQNANTKASAYDYNVSSSIYLLTRGEHWGTFAYMIHPKAAKILYDNAYPLNYQVDSYMIETCSKMNLSVYRSKINLVETDNAEGRVSDVQLSYKSNRQRFVPTVFHIINLPPMIYEHEYLIRRLKKAQRKSGLSIEMWDRKRLDLYDRFLVMDLADPLYLIKVLLLKLKLLYQEGGIVLKSNFKAHHSIGKVMHDVGGFIAFEKMEVGYEYPLIGSREGLESLLAICTCVNHILEDRHSYENIQMTWQKSHECMLTGTTRFPENDGILMFPAIVLEGSGYSE